MTEAVAQALDALDAPGRLLVAVSGGPDSMALLRLAGAGRGSRNIAAATVDHQLRPDSAAEAIQTGRWAGTAGVPHHILRWEGTKPATGVQEAARAARYKLLAEFANSGDFGGVLVAHTADDQAETVMMRLARGAGARGLGAMASSNLIAAGAGAPVRLLRPLLSFARAQIMATLAEFGQDYVKDPSNDNPDFERVRMRGVLAALEEQSILTSASIVRAAERLRRAADRIDDEDAGAFWRCGGSFQRHGWIKLSNPGDAPASLIARLVRAVGAGDYAPTEGDADAARNAARSSGAATLGGALLKTAGGALYLAREPAALLGRAGVAKLGRIELASGERALWDRRFILENNGDAAACVVAFGNADSASLKAAASFHGCPPEALAGAPALRGAKLALFESAPQLRVTSLLEERFDGKVMRFP